VQSQLSTITLLGITPTGPETEYGWIEPQLAILARAPRSITRVSRFWEKPNAKLASELMERGCLWNSFVMVGRVDALLQMTRSALPELFSQFSQMIPTFETADEQRASRTLYSTIGESNFSHQVLANRPEDLTVLRVGDVGWSDLGEPARVLSTLARLGMETQLAMSAS
jgi:mannose-1-phosphate guanylyltransferase